MKQKNEKQEYGLMILVFIIVLGISIAIVVGLNTADKNNYQAKFCTAQGYQSASYDSPITLNGTTYIHCCAYQMNADHTNIGWTCKYIEYSGEFQ